MNRELTLSLLATALSVESYFVQLGAQATDLTPQGKALRLAQEQLLEMRDRLAAIADEDGQGEEPVEEPDTP